MMDCALLSHFSTLQDPRVERTRLHSLSDIVALTICGVICGADGWDDIHFYACALESWYRTFLPLSNGIPSSDTIRRVIAAIRPDAFQTCFQSWVQSMVTHMTDDIIPIDGKTVRSAYSPGDPRALLHIVHAWSHAHHLVLAEVPVDAKSNEITAIPHLLEMLLIKGCIVTIDAMGCQKAITRTIIKQEAGYAITVKDNQEILHRDIQQTFASPQPTEAGTTTTYRLEQRAHGRYECRTATVTNDLSRLSTHKDWTGITHIGMITCERIVHNEYCQETRYFILSRVETAERLVEVTRGHWGIENQVHWSLDVTFHEDDIHIYTGYGAENLATVRRIALNALTQERTKKLSLRKKRVLCAMNTDYLTKVLMNTVNDDEKQK